MKKVCEVCGSDTDTRNYKKKIILCRKHRLQMGRIGRILKRTRNDKNKIIVKENYCEMELYNINHEVIAKTIFDKEFQEEVSKHRWYCDKNKYATSRIEGKLKRLHSLIMGKKKGFIVDHISRNPLDNKKQNLRFATYQQNSRNSKSTGIEFTFGKWRAYIGIDRKKISLGSFTDKNEALKIRRQAELKYFGEFAPIK